MSGIDFVDLKLVYQKHCEDKMRNDQLKEAVAGARKDQGQNKTSTFVSGDVEQGEVKKVDVVEKQPTRQDDELED